MGSSHKLEIYRETPCIIIIIEYVLSCLKMIQAASKQVYHVVHVHIKILLACKDATFLGLCSMH